MGGVGNSLLQIDSQMGNSKGEISKIEDLIATLTTGEGSGSLSDCLGSCMSLLEGLQSQRPRTGISFDEREGAVMELTIGQLHPVSISFVLLHPKNGDAFWMSRDLISQEIFSLLSLEEYACRTIGPKKPIDSMGREVALQFCNELSKHWGIEPLYVLRKKRNQRKNGVGIALPSLEQWRYALLSRKYKYWLAFGQCTKILSGHFIFNSESISNL